jgi:hypothetical protein
MYHDPKLFPSDAETAGWTVIRAHGDGITRSVSWKRGRYEIQFSASGHSSNFYKSLEWSTRPFRVWAPETGAQRSPSGRLRSFSSFRAAIEAVEEYDRKYRLAAPAESGPPLHEANTVPADLG